MVGIGDRISKILTRDKITQRELAKKVGVTEVTIGRYIKNTREPKGTILSDIANALGVTIDYLLGVETLGQQSSMQIPVYDSVSAGNPLLVNEEVIEREDVPSSWKNQGQFYGIRIKGDSMAPRYMCGDVVIVKKQNDVDDGDLAVVLVNGDEATFKQVRKNDKGITLVGYNTAVYQPHFYTWEEIEKLPLEIIGKVIEVRMKL